MTKLDKFIQETRAKCEKAKDETFSQSDESLKALANDVGLLVDPNLRIAASVASECLQSRTALPKALKIIEELRGAIEKVTPSKSVMRRHQIGNEFSILKDALARAEEIAGEK